MKNRYYRISQGFTNYKLLPVTENPFSLNIDTTKDWYTSIYTYSEEQFQEWKNSGSVSGFSNVLSNQIIFDLDNEDLEIARNDTVEIITKLLSYGIPDNSLQICFSGKKGFHVRVRLNSTLTSQELKTLCSNLAKNLKSFDPVVYDSQRIIRLIGTKHQSSGLYKFPLNKDELTELSIAKIKSIAENPILVKEKLNQFFWQPTDLPSSLLELSKTVINTKTVNQTPQELNFANKPKWLPACKYAVQEGYFSDGHRRELIIALAATYKAQGFNEQIVYRMLKGVAEKQTLVSNKERLPDDEIYRAASEVFRENWKGGQFSCQNHPILKGICDKLGTNACVYDHDEEVKPSTLYDLKDKFKSYVTNIDKNTIYTGIPSLDKNVFISTGANCLIIGAAGGGKSSIALNILNNTSKAGVKSVFASLDMHPNRMFEKVLYKISGFNRNKLYDLFKNNKEGELLNKLKDEFGNVNFFNKSSPTVKDIREYIIKCQQESGEKVKLVMLDYFERVSSDFSDDVQASKRIAGELQDLVNDLDIALITLVQPNKMGLAKGPDSPIHEYTSIKGSSFVYQSARIIVSLWRPFYNPKDFKNDKFMQFAVLKNDLGELAEFTLKWDGPRGEVYEMSNEDEFDFVKLMEEKKAKEDENKKSSGW